MEYINLGKSGLRVPKYILGTIPFSGTNGFEAAGNVQGEQARKMVDICLEAGINMFDTANLYSKGDAEKVLGEAIAGRRDQVLLTSKTGFPLGGNPNSVGASRINIEQSIDQTLKRLGTDYLDLYFVHLWDGRTPVEETVAAMTDLVKSGKICYWGVSNYSGWALARTFTIAEQPGYIPPICQQIYYTPEAREAEYELLPAGSELGIGSMIWSPLGEGLFNGKISRDKRAPKNTRQGGGWSEPWVKDRPNVGPVVIAARNEEQLRENIDSYEIELSKDEHDKIESVARPEPYYPLWHRAMNSIANSSPSEITYLQGYRKSLELD